MARSSTRGIPGGLDDDVRVGPRDVFVGRQPPGSRARAPRRAGGARARQTHASSRGRREPRDQKPDDSSAEDDHGIAQLDSGIPHAGDGRLQARRQNRAPAGIAGSMGRAVGDVERVEVAVRRESEDARADGHACGRSPRRRPRPPTRIRSGADRSARRVRRGKDRTASVPRRGRAGARYPDSLPEASARASTCRDVGIGDRRLAQLRRRAAP